jgi:shikimate kinase
MKNILLAGLSLPRLINLTATAETIRERLAADNERPLLQEDNSHEKIAAMLAEREPFYREANIRIDTTGRSVDGIVL